MYIGGYTADLHVADCAAGALTLTGTVPGVPGASFLAFSPDRRFLYATNEPHDTVTALDLANPTKPVVLNRVPTGAGPTHLTVHGNHLLTANYTDGTIAVHPRSASGHLAPPTDLVRHNGSDPHAHQILPDPSGRFLLATDLGADAVFVYTLRAGTLTRQHALSLTPGTGPRHLAFHPDGELVYILGELRPEITVATFSAGRLTPHSTLAIAAPGNHPAELALTRDAPFLYATVRGDNTIVTLVPDGPTLIPVSTVPTGGDWPRHLTLSPDERHLYVCNQRSGTITHLSRDPTTGNLSPARTALEIDNVAVLAFR